MPKLSAYVEQQQQQQARQHAGPTGETAQLPHAAATASSPAAAPRGSPLAAALAHPPAAQQQQQQQQHEQQQWQIPSGAEGQVAGLEQQYSAAAAKLQADYAKRLREHGPRCYRWPDGSLRPDRPPLNPHAVANRRQWAPLVQHCRTHGGDRTYERQGHSLLYGLGVSYEQHEAYLALIGLQPEADAKGQHFGEVPGLAAPLQDPEHCFNTYYKEGAEAVFKEKRGHLQ